MKGTEMNKRLKAFAIGAGLILAAAVYIVCAVILEATTLEAGADND